LQADEPNGADPAQSGIRPEMALSFSLPDFQVLFAEMTRHYFEKLPESDADLPTLGFSSISTEPLLV